MPKSIFAPLHNQEENLCWRLTNLQTVSGFLHYSTCILMMFCVDEFQLTGCKACLLLPLIAPQILHQIQRLLVLLVSEDCTVQQKPFIMRAKSISQRTPGTTTTYSRYCMLLLFLMMSVEYLVTKCFTGS